jgi:Tetratricopeptide repeat
VAHAPVPAAEPKTSSGAKAAAGAAAAAATAGAATAAAIAASASDNPTPAAPTYTEPDAAALKEAAEAAVKDTTQAIAAGNAAAAAQAAETMEDVVDDQIALTNEEAVEAVVGLIDAAADAEEAAADADTILQHAEEEAAAAEEEEEEEAVVVEEKAVEAEAPKPEFAATAAVVEEEKKEEEVVEAAPASEAAVAVVEEEVAAPASAAAPGAAPSLPTKKKNGNKKKSGGASKPAAEPIASEPAPATIATTTIVADTTPEGPQLPPIQRIADEPEDKVESLDQIPHPTLDFSQAPANDAPMNEIENKIRLMSLAAHKLVKDNQNKIAQASKDQGAALDLALGPEGAGKVRPSLVAACAFAVADMLLAQRQISETKAALATAYDAAQHLEGKNACVRALTNYAYVIRGQKPKSTRNCYKQALEIAIEENGISSTQVEQIKFDYTSYLAKIGHIEEAVDLLSEAAETLLAEGERLDKEAPSEEEQLKLAEEEKKKEEEERKQEQALLSDPGSGLDHIAAEQEAAAGVEGQQGKPMPPSEQARHFAMRNLLHASELMGALGRFDEGEAALTKAMETAVELHGENSIPHMNVLYAFGGHYRRQGRLEEAIGAHEAVLNIMEDTIEVYEPELLQNRVTILRDTAVLYDQAGDPATAVDYATGALVNAQTLAKIMAAMPDTPPGVTVTMLEPFWLLLSALKAKAGDAEGAAEAKREALRGKLNQGLASRGGRSAQQRGGGSSGGSKTRTTANGASSTRAGGRRV